MTSLYLGKIGSSSEYEIHAFTRDLPFREFPVPHIADGILYETLLGERYRVLESGKPIYCTAVNPDIDRRIETNPHDDRPGTVHFVAIDKNRDIACALSVAVDIGARECSVPVGLPLENRWQANGYPEGTSLDRFRRQYLRLNYQRDRGLVDWEMAELYRHFRVPTAGSDFAARIGLYTGCYHLLVREAIKKHSTPTWLWVFDAIPSYFDLYRLVGFAALRDMTIDAKPRWVSPYSKSLTETAESLQYCSESISRDVLVPIPRRGGQSLLFQRRNIHFLDGIIDVSRIEHRIFESPVFLSSARLAGFGWRDKCKIRRIGLAITGRRCYEDRHPRNIISDMINRRTERMICRAGWDFNHIGDLREEGRSGRPYDYVARISANGEQSSLI